MAVTVSASSTVIEVNVCFDSQDAGINIIGLFSLIFVMIMIIFSMVSIVSVTDGTM